LKLHFNCAITDIQAADSTEPEESTQRCCAVVVEEEGTSSKTRLVPYSLLIGADGTHSAIRDSLLRANCIQGKRYLSGSTWKALQLPAQPNLQGNTRALAYKTKKDAGRLLPRLKDRFVMLNFRQTRYADLNPFDATTPQELRKSIQEALPNVTDFPTDELLQTFLDQPAGDTTYMILEQHYVPEQQAILLGDAAVGMYSLLGQGCAYAMESAIRLAEALDSVTTTTTTTTTTEYFDQALLARVAAINRQEGKAIADLNLISHVLLYPGIKFVALLGFLRIIKGLETTDPYATIAKRNQWAIRLSNPFWRLARSSTSVASSRSSSRNKT
jgi:2-polyprenyl-6-methoxyphenol hydroxylase-like FAD-dependent oxidoreductase